MLLCVGCSSSSYFRYLFIFLLLGHLLATLGLLGTQTLTTVLLQDTWGTIGLGALLQCVEGDGQQLVALTLGETQLEAVEVGQLRALQGENNDCF